MKNNKTLNPFKLFALAFMALGLVFFTSCGEEENDCTTRVFYEDADGDGLGNPNSTVEECELPDGYVENARDDDDTSAPTESIAQIAAATPDLSDLVSFVTADEELAAIIEGDVAYTVFAPNNAAFEKLRQTLGVESLLQVAPGVISEVLRFHFHQGEVYADELGDQLSTVQGEQIAFGETAELGTVITTGGSDTEVEILATNINASNGVVHVVETILIPPTIFTQIGQNLGRLSQPILLSSSFTDVASLVALADSDVPSGETPIAAILADLDNEYTVFAPTNDVLEGVAASQGITKDQLVGAVAPNAAAARAFLLNHVYTGGQLTAADVIAAAGSSITMASGLELTVLVVPAVDGGTPAGCTNNGANCVFLASDPTNTDTYVPVFATDVYTTTTEDGVELDGAINGSLHVTAPITGQ